MTANKVTVASKQSPFTWIPVEGIQITKYLYRTEHHSVYFSGCTAPNINLKNELIIEKR